MFESERQEFLDKVKTNTDLFNSKKALDGNLQNPETLTQLLLDASAVIETQKGQSEIFDIKELRTREYIYKIHQERIAKLKQISCAVLIVPYYQPAPLTKCKYHHTFLTLNINFKM